jgi:hypothetical protein
MRHNSIIVLLVLLGLYWLFDHYTTLISHEALGLYYHTTHRIVGVICLALAAYLTWLWKFKK